MTVDFRPSLFVSSVSVLNASEWWRYRTIEGARAGV
jgi:hypothetical protein